MRCLHGKIGSWFLIILVVICSLSSALAAPALPGNALTTTEERDRLVAEILELDTKLALLKAQKTAAETRLETLRNSLKNTQMEKSRLIAAASEEEQNVASWLRFLAEEGSLTYLDVLLGAADLADFLNRLDLVITIIEANVNSLRALQSLTHKIETKEKEYEAREQEIANTYVTIKRSLEEAQQLRQAKAYALTEAESKLADFQAVLALSQAWEQVLPDIDHCLNRLSKLPWNTVKPDNVKVDYFRNQAEITFKEKTLENLLNHGLSPDDRFHLRCQNGIMVLERPALDYILRFTIRPDKRRLIFEPHSVTVGDTQVPNNALELLFKDRDLSLNIPLLAGLEIANAQVTNGEIRIFLKKGA